MTPVIARTARALVSRRVLLEVALAVIAALVALGQASAHSGAVAAAVRAPATVAIDGDLGEWAGALPIPLNTATIEFTYGRSWDPIRDDDSDLDVVLYVMWHPDTLYVAAHVADNVIKVRGIDPLAPFFHDAVLVFFENDHVGDQASRRDLFLAPGGPEGPIASIRANFEAGLVELAPDVRVASRETDVGYDLEAAVATSRLALAPALGATIGFSFAVTDRDTDDQPGIRQLMWSAVSANPYDPSGWGNLSFIERATVREVFEYSVTPGAWYTAEDQILFGVWGLPPLVRPQRMSLDVLTVEGLSLARSLPRLYGVGTWRARVQINWPTVGVTPGNYDLVAKMADFNRQEWEKTLGPWPTLERLTGELGDRLGTAEIAARRVGGAFGSTYQRDIVALRQKLEGARDRGELHRDIRALREQVSDLEIALVSLFEEAAARREREAEIEHAQPPETPEGEQ